MVDDGFLSMALDVEVEVPVLVRIRPILLLADDGLNAATMEEPSEDAPKRRIARTERDCIVEVERSDESAMAKES